MKKEYVNPEVVITSFEAESSVMLTSGVQQTTSLMETNYYAEIGF